MLFHYTPVKNSNFEKLQSFVECIFNDGWCQAKTTNYSIDLYKSNKELHTLLLNTYKKDLAGVLKKDSSEKKFYVLINEIYNEFKIINSTDTKTYKKYFLHNNSIENICNGTVGYNPVRYSDLEGRNKNLNKKLESFFTALYSNGFIDLVDTKKIVGSKTDYYHSFVKANTIGVCPFCGLYPIDGEYDPTRDAFDHYLPKSKYPFNSINIKNLAPSCNKCNSGNKGNSDPLYKGDKRRKAFYPFSKTVPNIEISIKLKIKDWTKIIPEQLDVLIKSKSFQEEVDTWIDLFNVDQRYAAKCCAELGGKAWLRRIFDESKNYKLTPQQMLEGEKACAADNPWFESSFLKKAFLDGCEQAGLFKEATAEEV